MNGDQKIKTSAAKAPLGMIPARSLVGPARVFQYGGKKYAPGNFHVATLEDGAGSRYVSAALRHLGEMQLPNGLHSPESLAALDDESGLPHIDHTICGLLMLRVIMVKDGALAVDPGEGKDPATLLAAKRVYRTDPAEPPHDEHDCDCRSCVQMTTFGPLVDGTHPALYSSEQP